MRTPTLGSVQIEPWDTSGIKTLEDLIRSLRDRDARITAALQLLAAGHLDVNYAAPAKPRTGDIRNADGTRWNPGSGEGIYRYNIAGLWVFLG